MANVFEYIFERLFTFFLFSALVVVAIGGGFFLYTSRARWLPAAKDVASRIRLPSLSFARPSHLYSRLPSSFTGDVEAGLSSSTFDLNENLDGGDSRAGLDDAAKKEILKIMKKRRLNFDRARKVYLEQRFAANGIGADGLPRDPKFVSFS